MTPILLVAQSGSELIPPLDEFGLPAWLWLFHLLVPTTFALHVVFMNFAVGAALVVPAVWVVGRRRRRDDLLDLASACVRVWPVAISFTITTGVAALLFVQVLYGHFFYTANILLGWRWLGTLGLLALAFYGVYLLGARYETRRVSKRSYLLMLLIALAMLMIAHEFNNNAVLMHDPSLWRDMYEGVGGKHARHSMWTPRMMHTLIGSMAVTGLWIAAMGRLARRPEDRPARIEGNPEWPRTAVVVGLWIALTATTLQVLSGLWFFVALEPTTQRALLDFTSPRTWLWAAAVLAGLASLPLMYLGTQRPDEPRSVWLPVGLIGFVLLGMAAGRDTVRLEMLGRHAGALYSADDVYPQTGALAMFLIALVIGLAVVATMLHWVWHARSGARTDAKPPG